MRSSPATVSCEHRRFLCANGIAIDEALVDRLYVTCQRLAGDADLADDAFQDTWLNLLQQDRQIENPEAWLHQVARHRIIDRFRERYRLKSGCQNEEPVTPLENDRADQLEALDQVLAHLKPADRSLIEAHFLADCSQEQLAEQLACSPSTISRRISAALQRMRRKARRAGVLTMVLSGDFFSRRAFAATPSGHSLASELPTLIPALKLAGPALIALSSLSLAAWSHLPWHHRPPARGEAAFSVDSSGVQVQSGSAKKALPASAQATTEGTLFASQAVSLEWGENDAYPWKRERDGWFRYTLPANNAATWTGCILEGTLAGGGRQDLTIDWTIDIPPDLDISFSLLLGSGDRTTDAQADSLLLTIDHSGMLASPEWPSGQLYGQIIRFATGPSSSPLDFMHLADSGRRDRAGFHHLRLRSRGDGAWWLDDRILPQRTRVGNDLALRIWFYWPAAIGPAEIAVQPRVTRLQRSADLDEPFLPVSRP